MMMALMMMMIAMMTQGILQLSALGSISTTSDSGRSNVKEVCHTETFAPKCDREDEVVVIETAQYGRLELGICVTESFGYLGCVHDVMPEVESRCSGRRSCDIRIDDASFRRTTPCHKDLKSHLWVSFHCFRVIRPASQCRYQGQTIAVDSSSSSSPSSSSFLSSQVTEDTGCGTADAPWILEAGPGQRFNLTLLDFASAAAAAAEAPPGESLGPPTPSATCRVYATIREHPDARSVTVCGGQGRRQMVFVSSTNRVEVRFLPKGRNVPQFLLKYKVFGCPDPVLASGMRMQRLADRVRIGCSSGDFQWSLVCVDSQWNGHYENCSSHATSVVIITVIAVAVVCLIMTSGVLCVKWRLRQDPTGRYPVAHQRPGASLAVDYDYGSSGPDKFRPVGAMVPCSPPPPYNSHVDSAINANEYATMRLLQRAAIVGAPGGPQGPVGYPPGGDPLPPQRKGSWTYSYATDHIYESPETMRKLDQVQQPRVGGASGGGGGGPQLGPVERAGPPGGQQGARTCDEANANHRYESPSREQQFQQRTLANATGNYSL